MRQFRQFLQQDEGASMVEMAVVMPFLFILAFGIFEFGNVLYQHHLIATGVRDAARFLARFPGEAGGPVAGEAAARQIAVTGSPVGGNKRVSWWDVGDINIDYDPIPNPLINGERAYRGQDPIIIIQVSTTVSYTGLGFLSLLDYGGGSIPSLDITLSHEERYQAR